MNRVFYNFPKNVQYLKCYYYSTSNSGGRNTLNDITHINKETQMPTMVDVSDKQITKREAHARSFVIFPDNILNKLIESDQKKNSVEIQSKKGPVFATSIVAGTMAAKSTHNLIPFCHPVSIESCNFNIDILDDMKTIRVDCIVSTHNKTGVEMEALTGCSLASLTIYDMLKALTKEITISETKLISKTGGKSSFSQ
ncbi:hypothetical protein DLAC_11740 [Tieghemostelium lacteum]|uniref:cyclic pyranopterin monophosphate synthase n=1 Tax=Tieghemostelium lacteum TaxID=361077 RepID=A0A151Z809_TIELA|nr:hypothetical protein DLAC_11740 [Tieghemostelium lacteum]|eukprot:KYQ90090.1 hypothetical protein DLAC_11740 [Tieghemostelium lacteum]